MIFAIQSATILAAAAMTFLAAFQQMHGNEAEPEAPASRNIVTIGRQLGNVDFPGILCLVSLIILRYLHMLFLLASC